MIRHVFLWSASSPEAGKRVFDQLATLPDVVPGLRNWSIGKQIKTGQHASTGTWQYVLMADFDSSADLDAYQNHPAHAEIVERVLPDYSDWIVIDYEV